MYYKSETWLLIVASEDTEKDEEDEGDEDDEDEEESYYLMKSKVVEIDTEVKKF